MESPCYPLLYQINTRVRLTDLSETLGRPVSLDDISDADLDLLEHWGVNWVWLLSVWQTGSASREVSRSHPGLRREFQQTLPDLQEQDIGGSGFAIQAYSVTPALGGNAALAWLRQRLRQRGICLLLDFVPNHTALDHPWIEEHPEFYVHGSEDSLAQSPQNYVRLNTPQGSLILAHGRDPHFPGWTDTLQLNYGNTDLQEVMIQELLKIADMCDGIRCDMAMLILPEVFERTWGIRMPPFWPVAIERVRRQHPSFLFMAEVYWDLEWTLQQQGFDYTYDKRLYDRLRGGLARPIREHLLASPDFQNRLARFLENHDEPRAAATFPDPVHRASAVLSYLIPGLRFFHNGQFEGRTKHISPHLIRAPAELPNEEIHQFYEHLLAVLHHDVVRNGNWQLLECLPAWDGNWTWDCFIAFAWQGANRELLIVVVNFASHQSQCYVRLPFPDLRQGRWQFNDLMNVQQYEYEGGNLANSGLYIDIPGWAYHVFQVSQILT
jgi:hypothetical protein